MVDIKNYEHLKLVPRSLMNSQEFIYKTIWTVVRQNQHLHYSKVEDEFFKATGFRISDFFDYKKEEMEKFLLMKKMMFRIDDRGSVKAL